MVFNYVPRPCESPSGVRQHDLGHVAYVPNQSHYLKIIKNKRLNDDVFSLNLFSNIPTRNLRCVLIVSAFPDTK